MISTSSLIIRDIHDVQDFRACEQFEHGTPGMIAATDGTDGLGRLLAQFRSPVEESEFLVKLTDLSLSVQLAGLLIDDLVDLLLEIVPLPFGLILFFV